MTQTFQVQGMSCQHCVQALQEALWSLDPQSEVQVDLDAGQVRVRSAQPRPSLAAAIENAGYRVQPQ